MLPLLIEFLRRHTGFEETFVYKAAQVLDPIRADGVVFRAVAALILAFAFVLLLGKRTIRWLVRQKIGDAPEFYHKDLNALSRHKANTPTMGGLLIAGAIFAAVLLLADIREFYVHMALLCLVWLAGVGGADDWLKLTSARRNPGRREGLFMWEKLLFQVGIALLLGLFIHFHGSADGNEQTHILNLPGQRTFVPNTTMIESGVIVLGTWWFGVLAVLVIAGSSNAVNLTDGMDGLASGIMVVVAFAFMILCLIAGSLDSATKLLVPHIPTSGELAIVAGAMAGACLGFLWFNCHPAQVFMGDTGSLPLGGLIGYIAVVTRQEILLLIIGGVIFAEMLSVVLQVGYFKLSRGSRLFKCAPIHFHFHLSGWSEQQVVVRFWLITAVLAALALATIKLR
jgi:phospho-N-acetylmuramoyl-pentapeptide-transferase